MNTIVYVALARGGQEAGYVARFHDLPGLDAQGRDLSQLIANAREALSRHLESLERAGEEWPKATPIEQVSADAGAFPLPVDVQVEDTPVRVNISIGEQLLKRLDAAAEAQGSTRSGFIAQAVRASLGERGRVDFEAAARKLQDELSAVGRKINEALGPDSAFSRTMADVDDRVSETVRKAADSVSAAMARRREAEASAERARQEETAGA
jgi:predicted RNase H-like HicB family nuclease